ncbi:hypothetical protein ACFWTE_08325 [Nocardiopsis sp. NPDC058631]|uniref:hypothetical protein n=1 Tax=Nocardiopsis sp. NPDC058631 TaxID=3346566 RepID=UPI0036643073
MIEILTFGVALGVHVPGLLLARRVRERGGDVRVTVLERLLPEDERATTEKMKWAFHRDFRVALAGQGIARDPSEAVTEEAVEELFRSWRGRGVDTFVVLSGFWLPIVARYAARSGATAPGARLPRRLGTVTVAPSIGHLRPRSDPR